MAKNHFYNPVSATTDPRRGAGYGKSQDKLPSHSTGLGSTYTMGWETGIYPPEKEEDDLEIELPFEDHDELRSFLSKVNLGYTSADSVKPRADRSSYGHSSNRFSTVGFSNVTEQNIPTMSGIVSIPSKVKYPKGLGMATGGSSSEIGSTRTRPGQVGGTGTQFGYARAPLPDHNEDDDIRFFSFLDLLDLSPDDRNFLKQQRKIKKALKIVESLG